MNETAAPANNPVAGIQYFFRGLKMLSKPGIRLYVIIPLLVNLVLFTVATGLAFYYLDSAVTTIMEWLPGWLSFLKSLLWLFAVLLIFLLVYFSFSIVANFIASPFNGLLAEQVEYLKTGNDMPEAGIRQVLATVPASLWRELIKIAWYLPWLIVLGILSLVPVINTVSGFLWFLFTAWVMALQYTDYASDNHQQSFKALRQNLKNCRFSAFGFGAVVAALTLVPIINLFVMPAAVCGGTLLFLDHLQDKQS